MKNTNNLKISARDSQTYGDVAVPLSTATQRQLRNCLIHFCLLLSFSLVLFRFSFRSAAAQSSRRSPHPYPLQLGDCIDVTVEGYPEYSKPISVCLDGFIPQVITDTRSLCILHFECCIDARCKMQSLLRSIGDSRCKIQDARYKHVSCDCSQYTPTHRKIQVEAKRRLSHSGVEDSRLVGADIPLRSNAAVSVLSLLQQRPITSPEHLSKRYWASPILSGLLKPTTSVASGYL
ncbi:hypothetical protein HYR99_35315 [Candidatus Poribacteria bacterium]|nr:hypothetical protein [Candidatus Poribacteria bacterium]